MRSFYPKRVAALLFALFLWLGTPGRSRATTYYVDATNGNDAYSGVTVDLPWKTISKVNSSSFQPGDSILFRRGQMWREQLIPPSSGTSGNPITFAAYSTGTKPVLSGADIVNGLPYMVNDSFTGNTTKGWVPGKGSVVANGDHLQATLDGTDNTLGDYMTRETPPLKEGWLMYRFNLVHGATWSYNQAIIGSGIIDGAFVGLINQNGAPMWRIRVERDGGFDYYTPALPSVLDSIWHDVKIHVKCASASGANDGVVQVWIDGVQALSLTGVDSDTKTLKKISMGNTFYAPAGLLMQMYLDDVKYANRQIDGTESAAWKWTTVSGSDGAAVYQGYAFYDSSTLFENRLALRKVPWNTDLPTTATAMQKGTWSIDPINWVLYVIPSAGGAPDGTLYEASTRTNSILVNGKNYTAIQGVELKNSDRESLLFMKLSGIEVGDVLAHDNGCQGTNLSAIQGQTASGVYIHDSVSRNSSWNGMSVDCAFGPSSDIRIINNTVFSNIHNGIDFKASANYTYSNITVSGNRSYLNGAHGLYMQNYPQGGAKNATISHNLFYRNSGAGAFIHKNYTGQEHAGIKVYGNTFAYNGTSGGFGPGLDMAAVDSDVRDNNFFTNSVSASASSEYRITGSGDASDFNNSFDRTRPANLYYNGASYSFAAFQSLGFDANGSSLSPKFNGEFTDDYTLRWDSPSIDDGTPIPGISTDIVGNPIYGAPDLGAFEYQPPYSMGVDKPDVAANVRIYGDGKYRNTAAPSGTAADLTITPLGGFSSGSYGEWMNLAINAWGTTGTFEKSWRESGSALGSTVTAHTVGDLEPNSYYTVAVDTVTGANISGGACSSGACLSDPSGRISFSYSGGYGGGSHTFSVMESGTIPSCIALTNSVCYSSIQGAYNALTGTGGTILVRNLSLTENLTFDREINVSLLGGFDAGFISRTGSTTVTGTLNVTGGSVTLGRFLVK